MEGVVEFLEDVFDVFADGAGADAARADAAGANPAADSRATGAAAVDGEAVRADAAVDGEAVRADAAVDGERRGRVERASRFFSRSTNKVSSARSSTFTMSRSGMAWPSRSRARSSFSFMAWSIVSSSLKRAGDSGSTLAGRRCDDASATGAGPDTEGVVAMGSVSGEAPWLAVSGASEPVRVSDRVGGETATVAPASAGARASAASRRRHPVHLAWQKEQLLHLEGVFLVVQTWSLSFRFLDSVT